METQTTSPAARRYGKGHKAKPLTEKGKRMEKTSKTSKYDFAAVLALFVSLFAKLGVKDSEAAKVAAADIATRLNPETPDKSRITRGKVITFEGSDYIGFDGNNGTGHPLTFRSAGRNPVINGKPRYSAKAVIANGGVVKELAAIEGGKVYTYDKNNKRREVKAKA